jgi:CxxC-x17-CxxC domain-containing protein
MPSAERQFPGPQICLRQSRALGVFTSHISDLRRVDPSPITRFLPQKQVASCSTPLRWPGPQVSWFDFFEEGGSCRPGGTAASNRVMEFQDKVLKCVDCGKDFVFTAGEQLFFHDKQFHNDPKRCKACKLKRGGGSTVRAETRTHCSVCGQETTVPFRPTQGRPVLCRSCFEQNRRTPLSTPVAAGTVAQPIVAAMVQPVTAGGAPAEAAEAKPVG